MNEITVILPIAEYLPATTEPALNIATSYATTAPVVNVPFLAVDFVRLETPVEESGILPIAKAFERVSELSRLQENWDSYGSAPPTREALDAARDLLFKLGLRFAGKTVEDVVPFSIAPVSGGGTQIEWRREEMAIEVEISDHGKFGFLQIAGGGDRRSFEECDSATETEILDRILSVVAR
jgi:hypothetical protein